MSAERIGPRTSRKEKRGIHQQDPHRSEGAPLLNQLLFVRFYQEVYDQLAGSSSESQVSSEKLQLFQAITKNVVPPELKIVHEVGVEQPRSCVVIHVGNLAKVVDAEVKKVFAEKGLKYHRKTPSWDRLAAALKKLKKVDESELFTYTRNGLFVASSVACAEKYGLEYNEGQYLVLADLNTLLCDVFGIE